MAQSWDIDPVTGDYVMVGGAPAQTDSLKIPAYFRLKIPRGNWLYAPDRNKYGSNFHLVTKRQTTGDSSQLEAIAANALQPLADDGRASSIEIQTVTVARQGIGLETQIVKSNGQIDQLILPSLGV